MWIMFIFAMVIVYIIYVNREKINSFPQFILQMQLLLWLSR